MEDEARPQRLHNFRIRGQFLARLQEVYGKSRPRLLPKSVLVQNSYHSAALASLPGPYQIRSAHEWTNCPRR